MADSGGSVDEMRYRIASLEKQASVRDEIINRIDDKLDDVGRSLDKLAREVHILSGMAREAREQSGRTAKIIDDEATRKIWAAEEEGRRRQTRKGQLAIVAVLMAIASAGVSLIGGFAHSAWDQIVALLPRDVK